MLVSAETLVQQFYQFSHLPDVVFIDIQANGYTNTGSGQHGDVLQHALKSIHTLMDVCLHAVVGLLRAVEGNLHLLQLPQILGTLHLVGIEQVAVGNHRRAERYALLTESLAYLVDDLDVDQRLAAEPTDFDFFVATMLHDVAHHLVGSLGGHGDRLRTLLEAVEAAGIAARSGENGIAGDCLGERLE